MESLKPIIIPGAPGRETPIAFTPGAFNCTAYQIDGRLNVKCGSPLNMGEPVEVLLPATAQLLLPVVGSGPGSFFNLMSSVGIANATVSILIGLNFHPPGLSTIGSPGSSLSG